MTYRFFIVAVALMVVGGGIYYLFQEKNVAYALLANKEEKSKLLNEQIRRSTESGATDMESDTGMNASSSIPSDAIAGEILAGNYSSDTGVEVIIKRNKKAILIAPANPIGKGSWQIISNNILSITVITNGIATRYLFSIEDPQREIVEIGTGETLIYTRK